MPAVSKAQQKAAGAALAAKRGEMEESELVGASKEMFESMTEKRRLRRKTAKSRCRPVQTFVRVR